MFLCLEINRTLNFILLHFYLFWPQYPCGGDHHIINAGFASKYY